MNPLWLQYAGKVALVALLAGCVVRRRTGQCTSLILWAVAVLVFETMMSVWPERFFVWPFWVKQQAVYAVLRVAIALELAWRAFRAFPGARPLVRNVSLAVLVLTTVSIALATPAGTKTEPDVYETFYFQWEPRILNGTIWLFVVTARLVLWFNIPVGDWERAVSLGFSSYLFCFTTGVNLVRVFGWDIHPQVAFYRGLAFLALTCWWTLCAWRHDRRAVIPASLLAKAA